MLRTLVPALAAGLLLGADAADEANKKDLEKMQGDWAAASTVRDGEKLADDEAQAIFRTVTGNTYTVYRFDRPVGKGRFQIDATKDPKTIDALPANAPPGSKPLLGIYELDGVRYKACFAPPGRERPADFRAARGSGHTLTVWEREKK